MRSFRPFTLAAALLAVGALAPLTLAHEGKDHETAAAAAGQLLPVTSKDAAWVAQQKAAYPLDTCMVSDEKLGEGDMGKAVELVYHVEGQPDRLVMFCCKHCVKDFKKDPAKYLKLLDEAAAKHGSPATEKDKAKNKAACDCN